MLVRLDQQRGSSNTAIGLSCASEAPGCSAVLSAAASVSVLVYMSGTKVCHPVWSTGCHVDSCYIVHLTVVRDGGGVWVTTGSGGLGLRCMCFQTESIRHSHVLLTVAVVQLLVLVCFKVGAKLWILLMHS